MGVKLPLCAIMPETTALPTIAVKRDDVHLNERVQDSPESHNTAGSEQLIRSMLDIACKLRILAAIDLFHESINGDFR